MASQSKSQYLVISALGQDRPGIVNELSKPIVNSGCNIIDSRMTVLGGEFAIMTMIEGSWDAIAKLEGMLPSLEKQLSLTIICKRTQTEAQENGGRPYSVEVITLDQPGIVHQLADFFSSRNINIHSLSTDSYRAAHTGSPMFTATLLLHIPEGIHISSLREEFMEFCDGLDLDAIMEPVKA